MHCAPVRRLCERTSRVLFNCGAGLGRRAFQDLVARAPSVNRLDSRARCEDYWTMKFPPVLAPEEYKLDAAG
jgi:hypothetical protein